MDEIAAQVEMLLEEYPLGGKAVELLIVGRSLVARFLERPGVSPDECRRYIRDVDLLLKKEIRLADSAGDYQ